MAGPSRREVTTTLDASSNMIQATTSTSTSAPTALPSLHFEYSREASHGKILWGGFVSEGLGHGQAGYEFLQHFSSKLADHLVKHVSGPDIGRCQAISGKGAVHVHGDRSREGQSSNSQLGRGDDAWQRLVRSGTGQKDLVASGSPSVPSTEVQLVLPVGPGTPGCVVLEAKWVARASDGEVDRRVKASPILCDLDEFIFKASKAD
ncbi:hypothetical protein B0H13DRAFT_2317390 [Mycena leptocephala]|nr:hypothetical protein B0H13DRAFT_2317390 [Mycena leptocephala]